MRLDPCIDAPVGAKVVACGSPCPVPRRLACGPSEQCRIERDEELVVRVVQLASVDPCAEGRKEGDREGLKQARREGRDERVAV